MFNSKLLAYQRVYGLFPYWLQSTKLGVLPSLIMQSGACGACWAFLVAWECLGSGM
jgi:hypothetical protein